MSIHHHPSAELQLDYATGTLGEAWSIAIATHLALCPSCRKTVSDLELVGGVMLEDIAPATVTESTVNAVFARLEDATDEYDSPASSALVDQPNLVLPQPLRDYLGGDVDTVAWRRLGLGVRQVVIPTGEEGAQVRLLRIPAGKPVPEHSHGGLELTLVLAGAFSDETGHYGRGDLQEADEDLEHQPHAAPGEDCICLAVTNAPLSFTSFAARLVQPLFGI